MSDPISPNIERLTRTYIDGERFTSSNDVLVFAMHLLAEFDKRYDKELANSIKEAVASLDAGEGTTLSGQPEIEEFFDGIIQANRQQLDSAEE